MWRRCAAWSTRSFAGKGGAKNARMKDSEPGDRVHQEHELAVTRSIIVGLCAERVLVSDLRADAEQIGKAMCDSDSPACVGVGESGPLSFLIVENIDRANRQEIVFGKLPLCVIDETDSGGIARDGGAGAGLEVKWPRRTVVHRAAHQRAALINVVALGGGQESSRLIEPVRMCKIVLLQVVVAGFEAAVVNGVDAEPYGVVVALRH